MMNLYGGQGMGTAGTGAGQGGGVDLQQILAMLRQGGAAGGAPQAGSPLQPGAGPTPMSGYIGAPGGGMAGMQHPAMPPVAGNPAPPGLPQMGGDGSQTNPLMQMLAQMKGGQTGVAPNTPGGNPGGGIPSGQLPAQLPPPQLPGAQNPMQGASPGWLQMLLQHMQGAPQVPQTGAGGFT